MTNADDVTRTVRLVLDTLTPAAALDWGRPAGPLSWSCWETVEHMADDLFTYAAQLAPGTPALDTHVPFGWQQRRPGGPLLTVFVVESEKPAGLLKVLEACGGLFAAVLAAAPPGRMSFHNYGPSDPSGFAAMGIVELLVHTGDVAAGLDLTWQPPRDLCAAVLARLFPSAPADADPWAALRWSTGRGVLPGLDMRTGWTWDGSPR